MASSGGIQTVRVVIASVVVIGAAIPGVLCATAVATGVIVAGVWVGLDPGGTLGDRETGAKAALPIWIQFMQNVPATGSPPYFDLPDNVIKVRMNPQTGMLAADGAKNAVGALFVKGTEPKK